MLSSELDRAKIAEAAAQIQVEMMNDVAVMPLVQRPNIESIATPCRTARSLTARRRSGGTSCSGTSSSIA